MKLLLVTATIFTMTVVQSPSREQLPAVYVEKEKVAVALAQGGPLASVPDARVSVNRRTGTGQVEIHEQETDIFYVVDGEATFITGGSVVDGRVTAPAQIRGASIQGGQTHYLKVGDVIVIPAGTPHWFKEVPKSINYLLVKTLKPGEE